jgi:RimJ/RimL family protein N-acetyltransferase
MHVFLETERLLLRRFAPDDAGLLLELDGDPEVMRYIGPFGLPGREAYRERIETVYLPYYERFAGYGVWPAVAKDGGEFLGWFAFRPAEDHRFAREVGFTAGQIELGYRLRRAAWGRGYATEGSRALVAREFAGPGTDVVVGTALAGNAASRRVLEKAGLRQVGEYALPGFDEPAVTYALRRYEYVSRGCEP